MSLVIHVAHSGTRIVGETTKISSLDALRAWVQRSASIPPNKQVFLTDKGKAVRQQTLLTESQLYVFDSTSFSPNNTQLSLVPDLQPLTPGTPPDSITDHNQLQSWKLLFRRRLEWAKALRSRYADLVDKTQGFHQEQAIIEQSVKVAVMSLQLHIRSTEQKYHREEDWVEALLKEQEAHIDSWESHLARLQRIPANPDFARYIHSENTIPLHPSDQQSNVTLQQFVHVDHVKQAASLAQNIMTAFAQKVYSIQQSLQTTTRESDALLAAVQNMHQSQVDNTDEPAKLIEEVDIIVNKMSNDLDHVTSLPDNPQSAARASKMALLHTRNYLPHLDEYCTELNSLVQQTIQQRNSAAENFLHHMQTLSSIESRLAQIHSNLKALGMSQTDQQAFDTLNTLSKLPFVYGSLMIEAVRRREWAEKMKSDSATLAEEMATYQEEEERRRTKWLKSVDDVVKTETFEGKPLNVEVNLQADDLEWPVVQRQSLQDYIKLLAGLDLPNSVLDTLSTALKDLDRPTRKQIKHAKTFKNGSMHEAAFGTTSLMIRGEDEYKVLRDANIKLDEELKGQKSRVRRLEDILHRHTHMNRTNTGDSFRPQIELVSDLVTPNPASPRPSDDFARQAGGSRRPSSSLAAEEAKLAKRIVSLEAELHAAKEHSSSLEKAAETRRLKDIDGQREIDEAVSIKKDIMQNMEAQQREFADERRVLEQDLEQARHRIEEFEDEIDRLLGSRDHDASGVDARARSLEADLDKMRNDFEQAEQKHKTDLEEAKSSLLKQQQENQLLTDQLQAAREKQDKQQQYDLENFQALQNTHKHLFPEGTPPDKYMDLVPALEGLAQRYADHVKELTDAIALARSESESLGVKGNAQKTDMKAAKDKQAVAEAGLIRVQDEMEAEKAHAESLTRCLEDEREQLRKLRAEFVDGENGVDALRKRVSEEEGRVIQLSEQLADAHVHAASLDVEVMRVQKQLNKATAAADSAEERLKQRGVHAKEIAQRLYAQNTRLLRLLESLGFVVSHKDGNMMIERASRVGASTTFDPYATMNRAVSMSSPPPPTRKTSVVPDDPSSLTFIHWTEASNATDEESQYADYMDHISKFSTDIFSEAISKRLRDFEYTARKWQKEARLYKEKNTRLQAESSAKIAVKDFKEGDLALFLPTKGQRTGAWAAFNINAPHHFLREREGMVLNRREWLVARISKIEERVVDLSKPLPSFDGRSIGSTSVDAASMDEMNDNPFDLSDGLTWYMVHASEDKPGAPSTPGLGKSTVASSTVDARGSIRTMKKASEVSEATKTLNKSLDSRRSSSSTSKKGLSAGFLGEAIRRGEVGGSAIEGTLRKKASQRGLGIDSSTTATAATSPQLETSSFVSSQQQQQQQQAQVRTDLLWGP
jgi:autophagy-related protein 11